MARFNAIDPATGTTSIVEIDGRRFENRWIVEWSTGAVIRIDCNEISKVEA